MNRHLNLMGEGSRVVFNSDTITPGEVNPGAQLCPIPVGDLNQSRNRLIQNTVAVGAVASLMGLEFEVLEDSLSLRFRRQGEAIVTQNIEVARAGFDYARENFEPFEQTLPQGGKPLGVWAGNDAIAMGGSGGRREILCRLPHESVQRHSALDGPERPQLGHHGTAG